MKYLYHLRFKRPFLCISFSSLLLFFETFFNYLFFFGSLKQPLQIRVTTQKIVNAKKKMKRQLTKVRPLPPILPAYILSVKSSSPKNRAYINTHT